MLKKQFIIGGLLQLVLVTAATAQITPQIRYSADRIIQAALADSAGFERLGVFVDKFGHRFSGSQSLENSLDWALARMRADGFENVHAEPVMIPKWVRGKESATLLEPRVEALQMIGLGNSAGTPRRGIRAQALVVNSWDDLQAHAKTVPGKIVVYNVPFTNYGETVKYRGAGASEAAKLGAVASLVRSITPHSLATPHTGALRYEDSVAQIPQAAITVENAELLQRLQDRGERIVIRLKMQAKFEADVTSKNIIAELVGSEFPDEVIVMGGHSDSWDVGQGAMDDAGGCFAAWEALRLLKELGIRPKRTIRVVWWVNEENGLGGAKAYRAAHQHELDNHILAIESDAGVFSPLGFSFAGSDSALGIIREIASLLAPIGATKISAGHTGADIEPLEEAGVPGAGLEVEGTKYFWYHHTAADTFDKLDVNEFNQCVAAMAVLAYSVADMPQRLPR